MVEMRKRSLTLLSFVPAAIVVVDGLADQHRIGTRPLVVTLIAVGVMVVAGVVVQLPLAYADGPSVIQLAKVQYSGEPCASGPSGSRHRSLHAFPDERAIREARRTGAVV
jgi:hypothetical protein